MYDLKNRAFTRWVFGLFATSLLVAAGGCSAGSLSTAPAKKLLGSSASGPWTLSVVNDSNDYWRGSPPGSPITVVLNTRCIVDSPPWSYTVQPGSQASFVLSSINSSGNCFFDASNGTITIQGIDTIAVAWGDPNNTGSNGLYVNCGWWVGNNAVTSSYQYQYYGPTPGSFGNQSSPVCLWDGA